jgi:hypothetical protein
MLVWFIELAGRVAFGLAMLWWGLVAFGFRCSIGFILIGWRSPAGTPAFRFICVALIGVSFRGPILGPCFRCGSPRFRLLAFCCSSPGLLLTSLFVAVRSLVFWRIITNLENTTISYLSIVFVGFAYQFNLLIVGY